MAGKYIVFEGGEYAGKTTQAKWLADSLDAELIREPGSTPLGESIRGLLLDPNVVKQAETEVLLHAAARSELARTVTRPALDAGRHVVSDRSWLSSVAYQGAQGISFESIHAVNRFALGSLIKADLCFLLDADPRELTVRAGPAKADYYEQLDMSFHIDLRERFLEVGKMYGAIVIDALQSQEAITQQVLDITAQAIG